jgi:hypothetical protein
MAGALVVLMPQTALVLLGLKVQFVLSGPETFEHSHIWQESKEQSCLQKLKTIK